MDPGLIAFLFGVGTGFIEEEDEYEYGHDKVCPYCRCEFSEEELSIVDGSYICPTCLEPLDDI